MHTNKNNFPAEFVCYGTNERVYGSLLNKKSATNVDVIGSYKCMDENTVLVEKMSS